MNFSLYNCFLLCLLSDSVAINLIRELGLVIQQQAHGFLPPDGVEARQQQEASPPRVPVPAAPPRLMTFSDCRMQERGPVSVHCVEQLGLAIGQERDGFGMTPSRGLVCSRLLLVVHAVEGGGMQREEPCHDRLVATCCGKVEQSCTLVVCQRASSREAILSCPDSIAKYRGLFPRASRMWAVVLDAD